MPTPPLRGHRLVDHTADLGIEATGASREEALEEAALALVQVVTGQHAHAAAKPDEELAFKIEAPDLGSLAVAFLSELLWLLESKELLWLGGGVRIEAISDGLRLTARGNGVRYDPARHGRGVEVKAVTYHGLEFAADAGAWRLLVYLDI